jgi:type IV pilus assembly protein PilP
MSRSYLLVAIVAAACGDRKPPPRHTPSAVADVQLTAAGPAAPGPDPLYVYSPVGKRDPFLHPRAERELTAIQKWGADQFDLKFTMTGTAYPKAVLAAPDGRAWLVGFGDYVGNNWGKITAIERDRVVVTEPFEGPGQIDYTRAIKLELSPKGNAEPEHHMIDLPSGK